jgi:hypothetical protein
MINLIRSRPVKRSGHNQAPTLLQMFIMEILFQALGSWNFYNPEGREHGIYNL